MPTSKQADLPATRSRRGRGEPRRLLIESARELFNERGYAGAATREIADRASVSETLIFRYFGTKAGLFREAMILPFVDLIDRHIAERTAQSIGSGDPEEVGRMFLGTLYDLFRTHRGLAAMLFSADVHSESELAASGALDEVRDQIERLVALGEAEMQARGMSLTRPDLTTRTTIAMVAGMATFGSWFYGKRPPSRKSIIEELSQVVLGGHARPST